MAARSRQTVYVGVSPTDADDGKARIDVIALQDVNAVLIKTLLNQTSTPELQDPRSLTVHEVSAVVAAVVVVVVVVFDRLICRQLLCQRGAHCAIEIKSVLLSKYLAKLPSMY